jgi:hypothetical protein
MGSRPLAINACHCMDCKKLSGATHLLVLHAERASLSLEGETATFVRRADSGREIDVVRCANCGVRLFNLPRSAPQLAFVAAGTLDDPSWALPTSHIYADRAAPSFVFESDALVLPGSPADRQLLWDHFRAIYPG